MSDEIASSASQQSRPVAPPSTVSQSQPSSSSRPEPAVPSGGRESEPMTMTVSTIEEPVITASEETEPVIQSNVAEVAVPPELEKIGIEKGTDHEPLLSEEIQKAGVQTPVVDPVAASMTTEVPLPESYAEAQLDFKKAKFKDGLKWLTALIMYQWRRIDPKKYN